MRIRQLLEDDDAVSPVIGVILMVAITVILAAVIATFVLGLGEQVSQTAPQASFNFDFDDGDGSEDSFNNVEADGGDGVLTVTHGGGETIAANQLKLTGSSVQDPAEFDSVYGSSSEISAGDSVTLRISSSDTIRIVWTSQTGQDSQTLRNWDGPDA